MMPGAFKESRDTQSSKTLPQPSQTIRKTFPCVWKTTINTLSQKSRTHKIRRSLVLYWNQYKPWRLWEVCFEKTPRSMSICQKVFGRGLLYTRRIDKLICLNFIELWYLFFHIYSFLLLFQLFRQIVLSWLQ